MRVRNNVIGLVLASAAVLSFASPVLAQGPVLAPPAARPVAPPTTSGVAGPLLPGAEHVYTAPAVLGEAWARALQTVLDGMKHLVDTQVASEPLRPRGTPPAPPPAAPVVPAWRAVWTPAGAVREAIGTSPVQVGPILGVPPLEAGRDAHGENVVLLGARMGMPWMLP